MNRKQTRLLVENWRKVLSEGLENNNNSYVLEEGWKENLGMATIALNFLLGNIGSANANNTDSTTQIINTLKDAGVNVPKSSLYNFSEKSVEEAVKKCVNKKVKEIKRSFKNNKQMQNWLHTAKAAFEVDINASDFEDIVIKGINHSANETCLLIFQELFPDTVKLSDSEKVSISDDHKKEIESKLKDAAEKHGIDSGNINIGSFNNETAKLVLEDFMQDTLDNLGNFKKLAVKILVKFIKKSLTEDLKSKGKAPKDPGEKSNVFYKFF